ncbi:MAG TPA: hypothetical protein VE912_00400, partial [Bacteroidales bacterium]|nr:hypothetical protein [Bacteroidales bacterium]
MTLKKLYIAVGLILLTNISFAQKVKVLVTNDQHSDILIKWYTETIYTGHPANIYRQEKGQATWTMLNQQPVKRGKEIPDQLKNKEALFNILENKILES